MSDPIRVRIISAIVSALGDLCTASGYATEAGAGGVYRARTGLGAPDTACLNVFPGRDAAALDNYGAVRCDMPVVVEAVSRFADDDPLATEEALLADVVECMTAIVWRLPFAAGGAQITVGDTLTGATSKATAYVAGVTVSTGSWAGGDAAGTLTLRRLTGTFAAETLKRGAAVVATTTGVITGQHAEDRVTGGLALSIVYVEGGAVNRAHLDATLTGISATFRVAYSTVAGNPYGQSI